MARPDSIEPGVNAVCEPRHIGAAVDRQLCRVERFGRDQRQPFRPGEAPLAQFGERHDAVHHAEPQGRLGVDRVAEIEQLARLLVADDRRHDDCRADAGKSHLRLGKGRVVGGDRQVAQHHELAAAPHDVSLHRGDDRLFHVPRRHLECELRCEMLVRLDRVAAPFGIGGTGADVIAGAEAAPFGAQQHDVRRRIVVGSREGIE